MFNIHFGCKHIWLPPKGRVQYCSKCGDIKLAPCEHHWATTSYETFPPCIVQECTICGQAQFVTSKPTIK
jgi:RNase P subunit RPR2